MIYKIVLKGLKPNTDSYESKEIYLTVLSYENIDMMVNDLIYSIRNIEKYYKIKYVSKEIVREPISATY